MKKRKLIASLLLICMLLTTLPFSILVAADDSARNGPFETLEEAVGDRTLMPNREFVEGAEEHWGDEGPWNLFDGDLETKYGASGAMLPFWATWRYPIAFVADRFLFATANDNEAWPRRMGDGWRLYGSNDNSNWTVLYTGRGEDYENYNFMWFFVDLPDNNTAYRYYRLWADSGYDGDAIQLSEVELTGTVPAPAAGGTLMQGEIIGAEGGWGGNPETGRYAAFDGNPATFFDPAGQGDPEHYVGMRMDSPYILTEIRILPRSGQLGRFEGASIWGFNDDVFDPETATQIWVSDAAAEAFTYQIITPNQFIEGANTGFMSFAYFNQAQHGDVAGIELWGRAARAEPVGFTGEVVTVREVYTIAANIIAEAIGAEFTDPIAFVESDRINLITSDDKLRYRLETGRIFDWDAPITRQEYALAVDRMVNALRRFGVDIVSVASLVPTDIMGASRAPTHSELGIGATSAEFRDNIGFGNNVGRTLGSTADNFADTMRARLNGTRFADTHYFGWSSHLAEIGLADHYYTWRAHLAEIGLAPQYYTWRAHLDEIGLADQYYTWRMHLDQIGLADQYYTWRAHLAEIGLAPQYYTWRSHLNHIGFWDSRNHLDVPENFRSRRVLNSFGDAQEVRGSARQALEQAINWGLVTPKTFEEKEVFYAPNPVNIDSAKRCGEAVTCDDLARQEKFARDRFIDWQRLGSDNDVPASFDRALFLAPNDRVTAEELIGLLGIQTVIAR